MKPGVNGKNNEALSNSWAVLDLGLSYADRRNPGLSDVLPTPMQAYGAGFSHGASFTSG